MSNILGQIIVQLKANVAEYVSGMGSAAYASRQASKDIRESFEGLGGVLSSVLGPFGAIGEHIAETFSKVGQFSGSAAANLGKLGGAMGVVGAAGGVAVGALAAIEAGAVGLSIHTAESIAQLHVLSEQTQVSVEELSGLGYAAKQSGVSQESLTKALEKLNKSIFAAATAAPGAVNAFTRTGISARDAAGNVRSAGDVFLDIAQKYHELADGSAKGALAQQFFAKSGSDVIPVLQLGREGIAGYVEEARSFGLIIDGPTAAAAHAFEQNLNRLKAAGEGAALSLTKALLPSLQLVTNTLVDGVKDQSSSLHRYIDDIKSLSQYFLSFAGLVVTVWDSIRNSVSRAIDEIGIQATHIREIASAGFAKTPTAFFDAIGAANKKADAALLANDDKYRTSTELAWGEYFNFLEKAFADSADTPTKTEKKGSGKVDTGKEENDKLASAIERTVKALRDQAEAQLNLAAATTKTIAEQRLQIAENEASAIITKLTGEADRATGAEHAKLIALIARERTEIHALTAEKVVAADLVALNNELQKETLNYTAQITALESLVAAYSVGGAAIGSAEIGKGLEKDRELLANAVQEWELLSTTTGVAGSALTRAATAVINANAELAKHEEQLRRIQLLNIAASVAKSENAFKEELPALLALNEAYFQNAEAVREADVALKVAQFKAGNEGATEDQIAKITALYEEQSRIARDGALAREAANYDLIQSYTLEIAKLEDLGAVLQAHGRSTIGVQAAIYDAQQRAIKQWDEYVDKIGTVSQRTRAFFNELMLEGQNLGKNIFGVLSKGIDGIEDQLAHLVVTGQANFKQLFQSIAEGIAKAGIQKVVSSAAGWINQKVFGGAIPGLGGKPDGSSAGLALYVRMVDSAGNALDSLFGGNKAGGSSPFGNSGLDNLPLTNENKGDGGGNSGGDSLIGKLGSSLSGIFSKISDTIGNVISKITSVISSIASTIGSIISGIAGGIGSAVKGIAGIFGGFLAGGGDVTPGKAYVVGEQHPEVFVPHKTGQVTAPLRTPESIAGFLGRARSSDTKGQAYVVGQKRREIFIARERGQITPALKRPDIFTTPTIQLPPAARSTTTSSLPIGAIPKFPPASPLPLAGRSTTTATSLPIAALPNITVPPAIQLPTATAPASIAALPNIFISPAEVQAPAPTINIPPAARSTTSLPVAALPNITVPPAIQLPATAPGPRSTSSSIAALPNIFVSPAEVQAPAPTTIKIPQSVQLPTAPGARATTTSSPIEAIEPNIFVEQKQAEVPPAARIRTPDSKASEKRPDLFVTYKTEQLLPELRIAAPSVNISAPAAARSTSPLAGIFGGFLANGGDVTTGKAYIVGDKGEPEFFFPGQDGKVMPELKPAGVKTGDTYNFHFHGVTDHDSFKRSKTQMGADMQQQIAIAHGRVR